MLYRQLHISILPMKCWQAREDILKLPSVSVSLHHSFYRIQSTFCHELFSYSQQPSGMLTMFVSSIISIRQYLSFRKIFGYCQILLPINSNIISMLKCRFYPQHWCFLNDTVLQFDKLLKIILMLRLSF